MSKSKDSKRYSKCKACGKDTVHLCSNRLYELYGDSDDNQGDESEFGNIEAKINITVIGYICMDKNCGTVQGVEIEHPSELDTSRQIIWQLLRDKLPEELQHKWQLDVTSYRSCIKCGLVRSNPAVSPLKFFFWDYGKDRLGEIPVSVNVALLCSGEMGKVWG